MVPKIRVVWHVYYNTRGAAGAYIDALQKAMWAEGLYSRAIVSCAYKFRTAGVLPFFFPFTDRVNYRGIGRRLLRGGELSLGYLILWSIALFERPLINFSMNEDLAVDWLFLKLCRICGLVVFVTCHDLRTHDGGLSERRLEMIRTADAVIVHNQHACERVAAIVGHENVIVFPFPGSPYEGLLSAHNGDVAKRYWEPKLDRRPFICMIGFVRRSKGIETLLEAWNTLEDHEGFNLVIAGLWHDSGELKPVAGGLRDCIVEDRYVNDDELVYLIKAAKCVLLPYLDYTHSSVLISVLQNGGLVVTSDSGLFRELLGNYPLMFPAGSVKDLKDMLTKVMRLSDAEGRAIREYSARICEAEKRELREGVAAAFGGQVEMRHRGR